jgi:flagellar biosynthesis chaperone FliJ
LEDHELERLQRKRAELFAEQALVLEKISALDFSLAEEAKIAADTKDAIVRESFPAFAERTRKKRAHLILEEREIAKNLDILEEELRQHFTQQKIYEQVAERLNQQSLKLEKRKENHQLDELALQAFVRKKNEQQDVL